jgi:hypothetical protein
MYCFYLAESSSNEFVALHDLVALELCHKYLPDLFSEESILKTDQLTKQMIDKAQDICKLTKVILSLFTCGYSIKSLLGTNTTYL